MAQCVVAGSVPPMLSVLTGSTQQVGARGTQTISATHVLYQHVYHVDLMDGLLGQSLIWGGVEIAVKPLLPQYSCGAHGMGGGLGVLPLVTWLHFPLVILCCHLGSLIAS